MSKVLVESLDLSSIAGAIRQKVGGSTMYKPSEMSAAVDAIPTGITPTGTKSITENGTHDVTNYASASVNVPNSYSASDEGKVVDNGALVSQTSRSVTQNGTYDTTTNDEVVVNVQGGGGIIESLSVTQNGTYTPPSGVDGYAPVVVNVSGGGNAQIQRRDYAKFAGVLGGLKLPFNLDENTGIEVEFMFENNSPVDSNAIGTWDTAISGNITWVRLLNEGSYLYIGNGTMNGQFSVALSYQQKHTIKTNINGNTYFDDAIAGTYVPTNPGRNVPLVIGDSYMTSQKSLFAGRIYNYKLYNRSTGVQLANIYPVSIVVEIGNDLFEIHRLYDSINNIYYDNFNNNGNVIFHCENE